MVGLGTGLLITMRPSCEVADEVHRPGDAALHHPCGSLHVRLGSLGAL